MLTRYEIMQAALKSARSANRRFEAMSGSWLNDYGVESFACSVLAEDLYKAASKKDGRAYVTLESSFQEIAECSMGRKRSGRVPGILNPQYRVDLCLWDRNEIPRGVIEVKRKWLDQTARHDLARLGALLKAHGRNQDGTIRFGLFLFFLWNGPGYSKLSIDEQYQRLPDSAKALGLSENFNIHWDLGASFKLVLDSDVYLGAPACVYLSWK